jgi:hypothetical protein
MVAVIGSGPLWLSYDVVCVDLGCVEMDPRSV